MRQLWIDPVAGSDAAARTGASRATALRTLAEAYRRVPRSQNLTEGVQVYIMPGTLTSAEQPGYWESVWGSRAAPFIIQAADGRGTVRLSNMNLRDMR